MSETIFPEFFQGNAVFGGDKINKRLFGKWHDNITIQKPAKSSDLTGTIEPIYFSGICSTCPDISTLLLRPFNFTISV